MAESRCSSKDFFFEEKKNSCSQFQFCEADRSIIETQKNLKNIDIFPEFVFPDLNELERKDSQIKGKRSRKTSEEENRHLIRGHWREIENKRYHWFLEMHYGHFVNRHLRRMDKIFKSMEIFIETRRAEQCRSHHQKMQKKYKTFLNILIHLRSQNYFDQDTTCIENQMRHYGIHFTQRLVSNAHLWNLRKHQIQTPTEFNEAEQQVKDEIEGMRELEIKQDHLLWKQESEKMEEEKGCIDMFAEAKSPGQHIFNDIDHDSSPFIDDFE